MKALRIVWLWPNLVRSRWLVVFQLDHICWQAETNNLPEKFLVASMVVKMAPLEMKEEEKGGQRKQRKKEEGEEGKKQWEWRELKMSCKENKKKLGDESLSCSYHTVSSNTWDTKVLPWRKVDSCFLHWTGTILNLISAGFPAENQDVHSVQIHTTRKKVLLWPA